MTHRVGLGGITTFVGQQPKDITYCLILCGGIGVFTNSAAIMRARRSSKKTADFGYKNNNSKPHRDAARARPTPLLTGYTEGIGEHEEEVAGRDVHLIAFPGENGSKVRLRKAEERSQHTKNILNMFTSGDSRRADATWGSVHAHNGHERYNIGKPRRHKSDRIAKGRTLKYFRS